MTAFISAAADKHAREEEFTHYFCLEEREMEIEIEPPNSLIF